MTKRTVKAAKARPLKPGVVPLTAPQFLGVTARYSEEGNALFNGWLSLIEASFGPPSVGTMAILSNAAHSWAAARWCADSGKPVDARKLARSGLRLFNGACRLARMEARHCG